MRTFIYLAIMNASSTIGRLSSGPLSNRYVALSSTKLISHARMLSLLTFHSYGALKVHTTVMFVGALLIYIQWSLANTVGKALAFVIMFGIVSGAIIGLPPASVANIIDMSTDVDHSKLGQWTGMMYTMASLFALTGPVIAGHLVSHYGNAYIAVQMWSGTCLLFSALCMLAAIYNSKRREMRLRNFPKTLSSAMSSIFLGNGDDTDIEMGRSSHSKDHPTADNPNLCYGATTRAQN
jgi:MCP family monocarboxylic acid transporter-like MFS transporter 10